MKRLALIVMAAAVAGCSQNPEKYKEYCDIAYSDIISFLVQGYQSHWENMSPEDMDLSPVYGYESEFVGFVQTDINGDGVDELLIGDEFADGTVQLYDLFTFDCKKGVPVHLLKGGERDRFAVTTKGTVVETGSNSASDSFEKCFIIKGALLKEVDSKEEGLMPLKLDKVLRYVAPTAFVAVKDGEALGQLIKTYDDSYLLEVQDTFRVEKVGVEVQLWSAFDGSGVIFPKEPGEYPVYESADSSQQPVGKIVYEEGYCPDTYKCMGYVPGWLKLEFDGSVLFVKEDQFDWDYVTRF